MATVFLSLESSSCCWSPTGMFAAGPDRRRSWGSCPRERSEPAAFLCCVAVGPKPFPWPGQTRGVKAQTCYCVVVFLTISLIWTPNTSLAYPAMCFLVPRPVGWRGSVSDKWLRLAMRPGPLWVQVLLRNPRAATRAHHHAISKGCHLEKFLCRCVVFICKGLMHRKSSASRGTL